MRKSPDAFEEAYVDWKDQCLQQLREDGYSEAELANAEICEDGSVHFHRQSLYDITSPGTVTPWETYRRGK